jgi:hypothetical protein
MLQRLREACGGPSGSGGKLSGLVEVDECFVGGKEGNKHEHKKLKMGRGSVGKVAVMGLRERGGRTVQTSKYLLRTQPSWSPGMSMRVVLIGCLN